VLFSQTDLQLILEEVEMSKHGDAVGEIIVQHTEKLWQWYETLTAVMPDYFFKTFSTAQIEQILPHLFNIETQTGIQKIECESSVILIYLKSAENNLLVTSRMMRHHNIAGAVIHESKQKIVVDNCPRTLVIEYYMLADNIRLGGEPAIDYKDLAAAFKRKYKKVTPEFTEVYNRINWYGVADLNADKLAERLKWVLETQDRDFIRVSVEKVGGRELRLVLTRPCAAQRGGFFYKIIEAVHLNGFNIERAYFRDMTHQDNGHEFNRMPVIVNTLYLTSDKDITPNSKPVARLLQELKLCNWVDMSDLLHQELVSHRAFSLADTNLIRAAAEFSHSQLSFVDRNAYNGKDVLRFLALYPNILQSLLAYFYQRFDPAIGRSEQNERRLLNRAVKEIDAINTGMSEKDTMVKTVFRSVSNFLQNIFKTNFFTADKAALSFRMNPAFMLFYETISDKYRTVFPSDCPLGVFFFFRENAIGFQIRFSEIARGGWRTVIPKNSSNDLDGRDNFEFARDEIFREVFVLAHTQHFKNKDIYEGGSKMITLLNLGNNRQTEPALFEVQRTVCDAFLTLINYNDQGKLRNTAVVDYLHNKEIIEIGPDENMQDVMIDWISNFAEKQGYTLGAGLISGKPDRGINHKEYGVTSFGVHQYILKTMSVLGINPAKDEFSIKISGGPYGDVAGNELNLLLARSGGNLLYPNLKIVAITDGPAVLFDPAGIDRDELSRLTLKFNLDKFNPEKLNGDGAYIVYSAIEIIKDIESHRCIIKKNGKLIEKMLSRDEFMRMFQNNLYCYADIFIPCGGRPATIDIANWQQYCPNGHNSSKAIIEGANSFITPAARDKLQEAGILIIKDASANKCGVITSSYEIISGLLLDESEFKQVKPELVTQIMDLLKKSANKEAEWLFRQFQSSQRKLTDLTDQLSRQINAKNLAISKYLDTHPNLLKDSIILDHLPPLFRRKFSNRLERIPVEYKKAIVAVELATRIVYRQYDSLEQEINAVI
jgi:glutamate dehydrogenase